VLQVEEDPARGAGARRSPYTASACAGRVGGEWRSPTPQRRKGRAPEPLHRKNRPSRLLFRRPWHEGAARLALARQDPSAEGSLSRRPTPSQQFKRGRLPTGPAYSLPKFPAQVTTPDHHAASLSAVSRRFVSGEQSIVSGLIAAGRFEGRRTCATWPRQSRRASCARRLVQGAVSTGIARPWPPFCFECTPKGTFVQRPACTAA
jgi:hypothetical protein